MVTSNFSMEQDRLVNILVSFDVPKRFMEQTTAMEVILGESLLTPGLQTSVKVHSYLHNLPIKDLDVFKGVEMQIQLERKVNELYGVTKDMEVWQTVYRIDTRKLINNNVEEFIFHACDPTLLDDAATLVSKMWKCTTPSAVVSDVLSSCAGAKVLDIESSGMARDYIAENIHPFQVVAQQANVALAAGDDPARVREIPAAGGLPVQPVAHRGDAQRQPAHVALARRVVRGTV